MGFSDFIGSIGSGLASAGEAVVDTVVEVGGDVRDSVSMAFGGDSMEENAAEERAAAAREAGQQERRELAAENRKLQAKSGYDPPSITQHENWRSVAHARIYETNQSSLNEEHASAVGKGWENIGQKLDEIALDLKARSTKAISSGWEGQAADAAKRSVEPLAQWMQKSGEVFHLTGNKIKQAGSAAGQVKASVPRPDDHDMSQTMVASLVMGPFGGAGDAVQQMRARREAERQAQDTMQRVYTATYADVDSTVPAYNRMDGQHAPPPQPPPPSVPAPPPPVPPGGSGGGYGGHRGGGGNVNPAMYSGGGGGSAAGHPGGGGSGSPDRPGGGANHPGHPGGGSNSAQPPARSGSAWYPGTPAPTAPGAAAPGTGAPGGARPGVPGAVGGYLPGGAGRAGGAGGSAGRVGGSAGSQVSPGARSGSGSVRTPGATGTPGTTSASSTGRAAGRMPMGAMGAGQGGQGDEDEEHERPSWLEEWDDVWLNDMPRTAPPVIGE